MSEKQHKEIMVLLKEILYQFKLANVMSMKLWSDPKDEERNLNLLNGKD